MKIEMRAKGQITIPKELLDTLGLSAGDEFKIFETDGIIHLEPVKTYSTQKITEFKEEINQIKSKIASGEQPTFDSIDALFATFEK